MTNTRFLITVSLGMVLASCNMAETIQLSKSKNTVIENRIENINQANLTRNYNQCVEDGRKLDNLASQNKANNKSLYHKSAQILIKCKNIIDSKDHFVSTENEMKNFALGIQNYIKAGNLNDARKNLKLFKNTFDKDLMYPDGSSFVSNMELLVNYKETKGDLSLAMINANTKLKNELKRSWYWSKN